MFDDAGRGESFEIQLKSKDIITRITKNYNDQGPSSLIAIFGHSGFMEIALVRGSAAKLLGLKVSDTIRIEFYAG
jgi:S-adenosylmethionine hydrolase